MRNFGKRFIWCFVIIFILGISVGYAAINRTLNINGNSEVKSNTWKIYFNNVKVTDGSVEALKSPTIENSNLSVDFSVNLNLPGDFYEFTVDVKNSGTIDAMVESINKTPDLTEEQKKYLNYTIKYSNGEEFEENQLLLNNSFVKIRVRIEYRSDLDEVDLPSEDITLDLGFTLNYIQADSDGIRVKDDGRSVLTFNIDGDYYNYLEEMTWIEWSNSEFNTEGFTANSTILYTNNGDKVCDGPNPVYSPNIIYNNREYNLFWCNVNEPV